MFKALGALLVIYLLHCLYRGDVFVKAGAWGRRIYRSEAPKAYWLNMALYALLALALFTVF